MSTTEKLREFGINRICLSPYKKYSRGYSEPGNIGTGYVAGLKVDAGVRDKTDDTVLDGIVSYDRAEAKNAYIGQINMETASSFTGLQGVTLGYDILRNPAVDEEKPLFVELQWDGSELPIFDAKPLQDALVEYFGTESDRRHNLVPGAMVVCANKGVTAYRPQEDRPFQAGEGYGVWSAIAISFAADGTVDSDKYDSDNAKKTDKLESNKPIRQYKQIKNELTFFGENFLGFYGLEIDNTLNYRDKYFYY